MSRTEVHKFGGTSVGDATRITAVAAIVRDAAASTRIVVVASAMAGVTNALLEAAAAAERGDRDAALERIAELQRRHDDTLGGLNVSDPTAVRAELAVRFAELADLLRAVAHLRELTPRSRDQVIAAGEKLSTRLVAAAVCAAGRSARAFDADRFLETDGRFGEAAPLAEVADRTIAAALEPALARGEVPVVTGFCGRGPDGATTTLGRGGSDLSATVIARALGADEVTIWTDVDGVFGADPRTVPEARVVRQLNYREAAELSYYGAKVLHPRTIIPVAARGIPVRVRNTFAPSVEGTVVDGRSTPGSHPVKAVTAVRGQCLASVEGKGMAGLSGVAERVFGALARERISVTMISQSSSEASICLGLPAASAVAAEQALKRAFRDELSRGDIDEIVVRRDVALVAAVGLGMAHTPGVAARVFGALARRRLNVLAIAQGSSELNITLGVDEADADEAIRALHGEFGLARIDTGEDMARGLDLVILGFGKVGRAVAELILTRDAHVFERFGLSPRIVALADRSGFVFRPGGITREELAAASAAKQSGKPLRDLPGGCVAESAAAVVRHALRYRLARPVVVDVSDGDGGVEAFLEAFRGGADVVTANKKPLAGSLAEFRAVIDAARGVGRLLKAEATVGAGLPVVDTLEMLLATGDRLICAEGCVSGTLGFLVTRLEQGAVFSEAVGEAMERGYTEPDPVADLSGLDVARKALIIGRLSGLVMSEGPGALEGLVDAGLAGLPREALFEKLRAYDAPIAERVRAARARGEVLRYVARIEPGRDRVGLESVAVDSPLATLRGTDNMIIFRTERYRDRPLVVSGPGAGVDVTAMGVVGDILRIAGERSSSSARDSARNL